MVLLQTSSQTALLSASSRPPSPSNELIIKPNDGKYSISDVGLHVVSLLPDVTEENFTTYIKDWILHQRKNIGELNKIPREDLSAWKFFKEAPSWFFIPFLHVSPEESSLLFDYYNIMLVSVAFEIRDLNNKATDFHRELISTDLPPKKRSQARVLDCYVIQTIRLVLRSGSLDRPRGCPYGFDNRRPLRPCH